MDILARSKSEGKGRWIRVREQKFESEAALQNILYRSPEIIPIEKLGENLPKPKLFVKEAGLPGSGNTDLIGIDDSGGIIIIECKLATNAQIRRKVIGQILEYAAYLWQMEYDQFDKICCKAEKWGDKHLIDAIQEKIEENQEFWSEEEFKENLAATLKKGNFRLVIAVDALNDDLKRIIEFVNSRGENSPKIHALEMRQFESSELNLQMLVPELYGLTPPMPPDGEMNEERFIYSSNDMGRELYFSLKDVAKRKVFEASGFTKHGYALRYGRLTLLVLYPNRFEMWFRKDYSDESLDEKTVNDFYSKLFEIPAIAVKKHLNTPAAKVDDESWTSKDVDTLVAAVEILASRLERL